MRRYVTKTILHLLVYLVSVGATAGEALNLPTRDGATVNLFWHETPGAKATVLMLPGGGGGFGRVDNGRPGSRNFLIRTAQLWIDQGIHYAAFGRPSDLSELDYADRVSDKHLFDLKAAIAFLKTKTNAPIYVVGTSRGTISAAHLLIHESDPAIAGGVFSASVTSQKKIGALPTQDLQKIKVPVLVFHHSNDQCDVTRPHEVPRMLSQFKNAPMKKLLMVSGGSDASGNPCEPMHHHGFVGMESEAVHLIADWIRKPSGDGTR